MPRPLRLQAAGAIFHITSRGNRRQRIYLDPRDYERFLDILGIVVVRCHWRVHAYCLMPNHFHLLVETTEPNLSAGMQYLNGVYAQYFNRRHDCGGHLFQGRFHSVIVQSNSHLVELARYIVCNPVRAGLCAAAAHWPWSSYHAAIGVASRGYVTCELLLAQFGPDPARAITRYSGFVAEAGPKRPRAP
jgi:putative transposase